MRKCKAATKTIPIVFETGADPIRLGLVASLNEPGSNITGITLTNLEVSPKRLELLHEIMPAARVMVLLVNPRNPAVAEATTNQLAALALRYAMPAVGPDRDFAAAGSTGGLGLRNHRDRVDPTHHPMSPGIELPHTAKSAPLYLVLALS